MKDKMLPIVSVVVIIIVLLLAVVVTGGSDDNKEYKESEDDRNQTVYKVKKVAENCSNCIFTLNEISFGPNDYYKYDYYEYEDGSSKASRYTQFYEEGDNYVTDYNKMKNKEGMHRPVFLAATMNTDKQLLRAYTCGLKDDKAYCLEGAKDGSKYKKNVKVLKEAFKDDPDQCYEVLGCYSCGNANAEESYFLTCKDGYAATSYGEDMNCRLLPKEAKGTCSEYDYD